jgi:DNA replication protein DnaC
MSLKTSRLLLDEPENIEKKINHLKTIIDDLKKEKAFLLTENNIPLSDLQVKYDCKKCKDTGFLDNGNKCSCLKQEIINRYYKMSTIAKRLKKENFQSFDIDIFSNQPFKNEDKTPRENMKDILSFVESYVINFNTTDHKNLLFYGDPGQGKTFLCNCIAKALLDKGHLVIYQTAPRLIDIIRNTRLSSTPAEQDSNFNLLFNADLLIIDDLGTENQTSFSNAELFNIINDRLINEKPTIISTNIGLTELNEKYTHRISSRIFGEYKHLNFYGPDVRWET